MSLVSLVVKFLIFIFASYITGYVIGFISGKVLRILSAIAFVFLGLTSLELIGAINTGLDLPGLLFGFVQSLGLASFAKSLDTAVVNFFTATYSSSKPPSIILNFGSAAALLTGLIIVVPFVMGFFKSFEG